MSHHAAEALIKNAGVIRILPVETLHALRSPHKLRSTFGSNLYHETGDIYLVADVLGHSDINTTRRHYAAMADDRRRMAAKTVKLREEAPKSEENPDT